MHSIRICTFGVHAFKRVNSNGGKLVAWKIGRRK